MSSFGEDYVKHLLEHEQDWFDDDEGIGLARMENRYYPYTHLFTPLQVNCVHLKNRIVMGPMGNFHMAEEFGRPSNKMIKYFSERARGGTGLITSGMVPVSSTHDPTVTERDGQTYFPRINGSRTLLAGWRDLADCIHSYGAHFFIQLSPGMGRVGDPQSLLKKHRLPVSASWNPNFYIPAIPCRRLADRECRRIIVDAGQAAANAKAMTIDGVYLHGHEGYLLEQMTNQAFNRRAIGRFSDWQAFGLEMVSEIRSRVGAEYPIMYRIDLSLALNATYGKRMETVRVLKKFRRERQVGETLDYIANLVKAGVDLFDVDLGGHENWWLPHPPSSMPSGVFLPVARIVKDFLAKHRIVSNAGLPVPVAAVGKLGYPDLAEKALRDGMCDMIMLARPLLADPQWANKAYSGQAADICPCIGDQEACLHALVAGGHLKCSVNPRTGMEDTIPRELPAAQTPRKIGIVGAGPGGIEAAITASQRGHNVTLYDSRHKVGGGLIASSVPRTKYETRNYLAYLERQVEQCSTQHGLRVRLGTIATAESLQSEQFDALVICSGAQPVRPEVAGVGLRHVVQGIDLLLHPEWAADAQDVVVVGGGALGCDIGHWLAAEYHKQVVVIEMSPYFMQGVCTANRGHLIHDLERRGTHLLNCARPTVIRERELTITRNISSTVPDPFVTWAPLLPENIPNPLARRIGEEMVEETLKADLVVLAAGLRPDHSLFEECQRLHAAADIVAIGDSFQVGGTFDAVQAGFSVGCAL